VSSVIIGARDEAQLRQNLGAIGWTLSPEQVARLDAVSVRTAAYPYFPYQRQEAFARLNPPAVSPKRHSCSTTIEVWGLTAGAGRCTLSTMTCLSRRSGVPSAKGEC
jgi:hypothetical protein